MNDKANDKMNRDEEAFLDKVREELDSSCDRLDGHTLSRLNSIRHAAIEHGQARAGRPLLAPFGGLATACVLVLLVFLFYPGQQDGPVQSGPDGSMAIEDLDILTSTESLEFFEDLEFYQWLEENEASV